MLQTCTRRYQFCAGHRVMGHENKCAHLHGHNYVAEITAAAKEWDGASTQSNGLDSIGRIIDFSVLKEKVGGWIDKHWDHGFILNREDAKALRAIESFYVYPKDHPKADDLQKLYLMDNPTAENMARHLLEHVCPLVLDGTGVVVTKIKLLETENCWAEVCV